MMPQVDIAEESNHYTINLEDPGIEEKDLKCDYGRRHPTRSWRKTARAGKSQEAVPQSGCL